MRAVISGGTKGIGLAIAKKLLENGIDVALCSRSEDDLTNVQAALKYKYENREILVHKTDMSKKEEVAGFSDFIKSKWDTVDILINNAGVFLPGEILKEADGTLESQIETNLYSAYYLTRYLIDEVKASEKPHIFNMCSIASFMAYPNGGSYSISKFAMLGFSKVLREELKEQKVKVTSIMPGATWSASWDGVDLPKERLMQAEDIAIAVYSAIQMSPSAVMEDIILRPQLGDL